MTTGVPPPTIPSIETGTPPKEWSESILASNSPRDTPATFWDPQASQGTPDIAERSREKSHAAKGPQAAASHLYPERQKEEPHVSLPSTELRGAQPLERTGGVGALPGNLSESSVALLPEEREERAEARRATSRQRRDTIKPSVGGGEEESQPERFEKEGDETKIPREAISTGKEVPGSFQPSDVHSGSAEPRTAKSQEITSEWASAAAVAATSGMVETVPGPEEPGEKVKDVEETNLDSATLGQQENPSEGIQHSEGGYGGEYHPAQLHPPPPGASVAEYRSSHDQQEAQEAQEASTGTTPKISKRASVSGEKRPGFMTMMKGEMKIIAGKMSGDEHKVEEGKRLVHGEA